MRKVLSLVLVLAAIGAAASCKVKAQAGSGCSTSGTWLCEGPKAALYCDNGTYMPVPCRGPRGCFHSGQNEACDESVSEDGEPCVANENHACSVDHRRMLVCKDARWTLLHPCKGPNGCTVRAHDVQCDSSIAEMGDMCNLQDHGKGACSGDRKFLLSCTERDRWERINSCRGPEGCHLKEKGKDTDALCDQSIAFDGDPCDTPDERTCAAEGKAQLICKSGKFVKERDCKAKCVFTTSRDPPRCDY